jgi:Uma2 family endonuclease
VQTIERLKGKGPDPDRIDEEHVMSIASKPMTTEEFLALPDDGIERDLIRGELRVRGQAGGEDMTARNRFHSRALVRISHHLEAWCEQQPSPGEVLGGEVGCILAQNPDTTVGIDVAYFSEAVVTRQSDDTTLVEGAPVLAVEILSPSDREDEVNHKIRSYLAAGTRIVWVADPSFRTIAVYRPDAPPSLFNEKQTITAEPHLPGFAVSVAKLF